MCEYCHLIKFVAIYPYRCQCGKIYGTPTKIASPPKPGTKLKELIAWFPVPRKEGCRACRSLEAKMNRWGAERCREKREYIAKKLWVAAKRRNLPYSRRLVLILIDRAITNSEAAA